MRHANANFINQTARKFGITRSNLVSGVTHELFGRFFPDRRDADDPADVLIDDARLRLVGQLLQRVVPEEPQRMREDGQRLGRLTVAGREFRVGVEVLKGRQSMLIIIIIIIKQHLYLYSAIKSVDTEALVASG